ncbi:hypothetical protein [Pleionea sp. CnH1-48]|uniref:hypothetical protein n=1 Tax=Pleionea sp. CnH1-48 TaxID=2954494 RepID=UPI0020968EA2|nr:hypothetical protein [Pleionea sp. CnH1-48]MCO7223104.1 hypothetical protein [Pleionea sp. CnH1-48]
MKPNYIYLEAEHYLPKAGNATKNDLSWSIALNILLDIQFNQKQNGKLALFLEYQDTRGTHKVAVDYADAEDSDSIILSNLIELPVRGMISDVRLVLSGCSDDSGIEMKHCWVKVEESRCFLGNRPMQMVS